MKTFLYIKKIKISQSKLKILINKIISKELIDIYLKLLNTKNTKVAKILINILRDIFHKFQNLDLKLDKILINKNFIIKRYQPRAKGRSFKIEKKNSKLYIQFSFRIQKKLNNIYTYKEIINNLVNDKNIKTQEKYNTLQKLYSYSNLYLTYKNFEFFE
jgi:hypothetical protein